MNELKVLLKEYGDRLKQNVSLSNYSTFRIGGPAQLLLEVVSTDELVRCVHFCTRNEVPYTVIGGGSNILCSDAGYQGVVLVTRFDQILFSETDVYVEAGVPWQRLLDEMAVRGYAGLEWGAGIPGLVGGAIRGNAGAYGGEVKDLIISVTVLHGGEVITLDNVSCGFMYRDSLLKQRGDIVLSARIRITPGNASVIRSRMDEVIATRRAKLPSEPSAGSDFKNIVVTAENESMLRAHGAPAEYIDRKKVPTGWLIQKLGLLGTTVGGAQISPRHGNIIINTGTATASDVLQLLHVMKNRVHAHFGIDLQEELQLVGDF